MFNIDEMIFSCNEIMKTLKKDSPLFKDFELVKNALTNEKITADKLETLGIKTRWEGTKLYGNKSIQYSKILYVQCSAAIHMMDLVNDEREDLQLKLVYACDFLSSLLFVY